MTIHEFSPWTDRPRIDDLLALMRRLKAGEIVT
jgi:hypothetical protein